MSVADGVFSPDQIDELRLRGWTAFGKRIHARIERNRQQRCQPRFDSKRYAVFVEHDSPVVDENGEKAEPVKALIVTAPNIRAARRKLTETFPGHIRRFLDWKLLPLYPTDDEAA